MYKNVPRLAVALTLVIFLFLSAFQNAEALDFEPFFNKQVANEMITGISVSPDGESVAIASQDNYIHFFNKSGYMIWDLKIPDGTLNDVATNGRDVLAGISFTALNSKPAGRVQLYSNSKNLLFDKVIDPESNSSSSIQHVAISDDGSTIVASGMNAVYILDKGGNILRKITMDGLVSGVAISPNKEYGVASSENTVYIFDSSGRVLQSFKLENYLTKGISVSDEGYAAVLTQQKIFLYKNNQMVWQKAASSANFFTSISISPSSNLIAVTSNRDGMFLFDRNGVEVQRYQVDLGHISTDGVLVAGAKNTFLYLFNITPYATGFISVLSTQGAEIYLDEKPAGYVPALISNVVPGAHTIKIMKTGYETWVQNIEISYGDRKEISVMLVPSIPTSTPTPSPTPSPTPQPTPTPTPTPDVIMIPKDIFYAIMLGAVLVTVPVIYITRRKSAIPVLKINDPRYETFIGGNCPYCGDLIKANSSITVCPDCETPHHKECWKKHGGCTTFGCKSAP